MSKEEDSTMSQGNSNSLLNLGDLSKPKEYLPETKKNTKDNIEEAYAILDEMVGLCESDQTDGSVNHDGVIDREHSKS